MSQNTAADTNRYEPVDVRDAVYAIGDESIASDRPFPIGINQNEAGSHLLCIRFVTGDDLRAWQDFFAARIHPTHDRPDLGLHVTHGFGEWRGWSVQLGAYEPLAAAVSR